MPSNSRRCQASPNMTTQGKGYATPNQIRRDSTTTNGKFIDDGFCDQDSDLSGCSSTQNVDARRYSRRDANINDTQNKRSTLDDLKCSVSYDSNSSKKKEHLLLSGSHPDSSSKGYLIENKRKNIRGSRLPTMPDVEEGSEMPREHKNSGPSQRSSNSEILHARNRGNFIPHRQSGCNIDENSTDVTTEELYLDSGSRLGRLNRNTAQLRNQNIESSTIDYPHNGIDGSQINDSMVNSNLGDKTVYYLLSHGFNPYTTQTETSIDSSYVTISENSQETIRDEISSEETESETTNDRDGIIADTLGFVQRILQNMRTANICPSSVNDVLENVNQAVFSGDSGNVSREELTKLLKRTVEIHHEFTININQQTQAYNNVKSMLPRNVFNALPSAELLVQNDYNGGIQKTLCYDSTSSGYIDGPSRHMGKRDATLKKDTRNSKLNKSHNKSSIKQMSREPYNDENDSDSYSEFDERTTGRRHKDTWNSGSRAPSHR